MRRTILGILAAFGLTAIPLSAQDFLVWEDGEPLRWRGFLGPVPADKPADHGAESRLLIAVGLTCTNDPSRHPRGSAGGVVPSSSTPLAEVGALLPRRD